MLFTVTFALVGGLKQMQDTPTRMNNIQHTIFRLNVFLLQRLEFISGVNPYTMLLFINISRKQRSKALANR
jgi:hypothetical protein